MKITIRKVSPYKNTYTVLRANGSSEEIELNTKTFFIHDITHFVVEQTLAWQKGFWGMLANGYRFNELFGKENELTEELRSIEKVVGPIQSVYQGHFKKEDFATFTNHLDVNIDTQTLDKCLSGIDNIVQQWRSLEVGESIELTW